jgi:hypothetical protein
MINPSALTPPTRTGRENLTHEKYRRAAPLLRGIREIILAKDANPEAAQAVVEKRW